MSIKVMIIDAQADFRTLLMHHLTTHWSDAVITAYDPVAAGHLPEEFSGAGNDVVLLGDELGDREGPDLVRQFSRRPRFPAIVYFGSDRDGVMNLYRFRPGAQDVEQLTRFTEFHVRNLDTGGGALVFEQAGALHLWEAGAEAPRRLAVHVRSDGLAALPRWQEVKGHVRSAAIAPGVFETEMVASMKPEAHQRITDAVPLGRTGEVAELAHAVRFIVENDYINGECIRMDGGIRMQPK